MQKLENTNDIFQQTDNYRVACTTPQSRNCDFFTLTRSWHVISHRCPYKSREPLPQQSLLRSFTSCSTKKISPISLFITFIYKSTGATLEGGSQFLNSAILMQQARPQVRHAWTVCWSPLGLNIDSWDATTVYMCMSASMFTWLH